MPTQEQQNNFLYKKSFGLQSTSAGLDLAGEYNLNLPPHSRQIQASLVRKEAIPDEAPPDLRLDSRSSTDPMYLPLNEELDDNGESLTGSLAGRTSTINPHIRRYSEVPLVAIGSAINTVTVAGRTEDQFQLYAGIRGAPPNANTPFTIQTSHPNQRFAPSARSGVFIKTTQIINAGATTIHVNDTSGISVGDYVRDLSGCISYNNSFTVQSVNHGNNTFVLVSDSVPGVTALIASGATIIVWRRTFRTVNVTVQAGNTLVLEASGGETPSIEHMFGTNVPLEVGDVAIEPISSRDHGRIPYFDTWDPLKVQSTDTVNNTFVVECTDTTITIPETSTPFAVNLHFRSEGSPPVGGQDFSDVTTNQISATADPAGSFTAIIHKYNEQGVVSNVPNGAAGGDPQLDIDGGTLRFFVPRAGALSKVTSNRPPAISFYRYVGEYGVGGNSVLFDSGLQAASSGSHGFDIKAIQIDSRNLSTIDHNSQALQFGGDQLGAWRILIKNQVDDGCFPTEDSDTSFHIQTYKGGNWVDMQVIVNE